MQLYLKKRQRATTRHGIKRGPLLRGWGGVLALVWYPAESHWFQRLTNGMARNNDYVNQTRNTMICVQIRIIKNVAVFYRLTRYSYLPTTYKALTARQASDDLLPCSLLAMSRRTACLPLPRLPINSMWCPQSARQNVLLAGFLHNGCYALGLRHHAFTTLPGCYTAILQRHITPLCKLRWVFIPQWNRGNCSRLSCPAFTHYAEPFCAPTINSGKTPEAGCC